MSLVLVAEMTSKQVHPTLKQPLNALGLVTFLCIVLSCIYVASTTAFNAIISLQAMALELSYMFPILFVMIRKLQGRPPPYGPVNMGRYGVWVNAFAVCYLLYVFTWMPFPQELPVTGSNMNYAGPILGAVLVGAVVDYAISGRKRFQVPLAIKPEDLEHDE